MVNYNLPGGELPFRTGQTDEGADMEWRRTVSLMLVLAACGGCVQVQDMRFNWKAKAVLTGALNDPDSAQFRNVVVVRHGELLTLCGEVNAKNRMGGYVGFQRFMVTGFANGMAVEAMLPMIDGGELKDFFAAQWEKDCGTKRG